MTSTLLRSRYATVVREVERVARAYVETRNCTLRVERTEDMSGHVYYTGDEYIVTFPQPTSSVRLAIALHEFGHILNGDFWKVDRFIGMVDTPFVRLRMEQEAEADKLPNEVRASRFALRMLDAYGIDPAAARDFLIGCLVSYGMDKREAWTNLNRT